ncbi:MAG: hypothetical protein Q9160_000926 [Pyrenula sp. 1 TL-2023]
MAATTLRQTPHHHQHHPHYLAPHLTPSSHLSNSHGLAADSPEAPSNIAASLPSVDFNFADLRERMAAFTVKFDAFIEKGRRGVMEERNGFRGRMGELREEQSTTLSTLRALSSVQASHSSLLTAQSYELRDLHSTISQITSRHDALAHSKEKLRAQIEETKRKIERQKEKRREWEAGFERQRGRDGPECEFWEGVLGLRLESAAGGNGSVKDGWVRVGFWELPTSATSTATTNPSKTPGKSGDGNATAEAFFELDCSGAEYRLGKCVPPLPVEKTEGVLERLNAEGDIAAFLKRMRGVVVGVLNGEA